MGVGIGPLVFGLLSQVIINSNDFGSDVHTGLYPRKVLNNFMTFMRVIAFIWFFVMTLAIIIIQPHPNTLRKDTH